MKKLIRMVCVFLISINLVVLAGCDEGMSIIGLRIDKFPEKLIYVIGEDSKLDLRGGQVTLELKEGSTHKSLDRLDDINEAFVVDVKHDIDFTKEGIYLVKLERYFCECTFPIQVVHKDVLEGGEK